MPAPDFRNKIKALIIDEVTKRIKYIQKKIIDFDLQGHNFYIYVLPFTDIDSKRKIIMEAITK